MSPEEILHHYNLDPKHCKIERIGSGYINATYKIVESSCYVLQRINKKVFIKPEDIAGNLRTAADYLSHHHPDYLFLSAIKDQDGRDMVYDEEGFPWRLFPFIENSKTINHVETTAQAFSAAAAFAQLTSYLEGVDLNLFKATIHRFHDLQWRFEQFQTALTSTTEARLDQARDVVEACLSYKNLVDQYNYIITSRSITQRIVHNDAKLNNILFDVNTNNAICIIDLDTLMPGYFIYDIGDMIRTFVSPVNEEEADLEKIIFRKDIYEALIDGYQSQMKQSLTVSERSLILYGGMMMTYMMALRMLTDFLHGNVYYQISYSTQNLVRARNQVRLLQVLEQNKS